MNDHQADADLSSLRRLEATLLRQVELLEAQLHHAAVTRAMLLTQDRRFLQQAATDVEVAAEDVRELEMLRAMALADVARDLRLRSSEPTLSEVIAAAPDEHVQVLERLADRFHAVLDPLGQIQREAAGVAVAGLDRVRVGLEQLATGTVAPGYASSGAASPPPARFDGRA